MANFFWKTAQQLRQPLACFGAFAAGCLIVGNVTADDNNGPEQPTSSKLERIFGEQDYRMSAVPPINGRVNKLAGEAQGSLQSQSLNPIGHAIVPYAVVSRSPSAKEILGKIKQPIGDPAREITARMVMPVETIEKKQVWIAPELAMPTEGYGDAGQRTEFESFPTALVSFQQPAQQSRTGHPGQSSTQRSSAPVQRVARAEPNHAAARKWTGVHTLRNLDIQKFESEIVRTWGSQLRSSTSPDGRYVRVDLPTRVAHPMVMMIDRQTGVLSYEGHSSLLDNWHLLMQGIDSRPQHHANGTTTETVVVDQGKANINTVRQAAYLMGMTQDTQDDPKPGQSQATLPPGTIIPQGDALQQTQGLKGTVKIIEDPETGKLTVVGDAEDLKVILAVIRKINEDTERTTADVQRIPLVNLQSEAVAERIQTMYDERFAASKGPATVTPLASPNSLIVLGQTDAIESVRNIVAAMDVQADPSEMGGFKAFTLKYISAADAKQRLDAYFNQAQQSQGDNQLPSAPVIVVSDFRSNTIIVKGSVQFINQAEQLLTFLDIDSAENGAVNQIKIFPLRNTVAQDMAIVIQDAINGQQPNAGAGYNPNQQAQGQNQQNNQNPTPYDSRLRAAQLSLTTIDAEGKQINGGFMFDVRVTADANSNSLVVTGPAASMDLVEALIKRLDRLPSAETQIKVFEIINGDAESLLTMLEALFGSDTQANQGQNQQGGTSLAQLPLQGAGTDGQTLVNLRFSVDARTNTIISSGAAGDLQIVEDLLNRLDAQLANVHLPIVYRLSNTPATDIAEAINTYLDTRGDIIASDPRAVGDINQTNRAIIVVPELISNSLIVSALPQYRAEIEGIIKALDRRPPMVKVKCLIAEVDLSTLEEFGVEMGVQDSLLFDRNTTLGAAGSIANGIGFPFINPSTSGNRNAVSPGNLAGQALSKLGVGGINSELGYGGLVLSGGSESINILIRALKNREAVRVLSKPHITTLENLQGRISVGSNVARAAGSTLTSTGFAQQNIAFEDVGVILEITPRVSPDGMIVMTVNLVKNRVGDGGTVVDVAVDADGNQTPIVSSDIDGVEANTTLMARSGQTVVFSGLIQESKAHFERGTPILSDLPYIGPLFKFEGDRAERKELLMFLTPYLVSEDAELQFQNQDEMERMHWCLGDVAEIYGNPDYDTFNAHENASVDTFYPDSDPVGMNPQRARPSAETPQPGFETSSLRSGAQGDANANPAARQASYDVTRQN